MPNKGNDSYLSLKIGQTRKDISLLCAIGFLYFTRYSFLSFARSFSLSTAVIGGGMMILFFAAFILYTIKQPKNIAWGGVAIVIVALLFFEVTLMIHPEYQVRYDDLVRDGRYGFHAVFSFGAGIYAYYIVRLFKNDGEKLYRLFNVIGYIILFFDIWSLFFNRTEDYKMGFGYQMEFAAIIFLASYLSETRKKFKLLLSLACILMGVLYGSRGCVIGYVFFIGVYLVWKREFDWKKVVLIVFGFLGVIAVISPTIISLVYNIFTGLGFQSRTLYYLAAGDILAVDTARQDRIWPILIDKLKSMSIFDAMGAYGDRTLLTTYYPYAHNFVLEILLTFGILIGGAFLIWMVIQFVKVVKNNRDYYGLITIIFGSFSLCRLFLSSTFWQEPYFWAFIAMLINCAVKRRKEKIVANNEFNNQAVNVSGGQTVL